MAKRRTEKFPPEEVDYLLAVARGWDTDGIPDSCKWMKELEPIQARDILLYRFQSIIASLVETCLKGKFWTSYSKTFLRLFAGKGVPLQNVATVLKKELSVYDRKELWHAGQVAALRAIEKCEKNLASTIVFCFKEEIANLINKETKQYLFVEMDESHFATPQHHNDIAWDIFMDELSEEEWLIAQKLIDGEPLKDGEVIPESLKKKLKTYMEA